MKSLDRAKRRHHNKRVKAKARRLDIERGNWQRVLVMSPGGIHPGRNPANPDYSKYVDQWTYSEQQGYRFACRHELAYFNHRLIAAGVKEIIFYIGRPDMVADPLVDGWESVRPYLEAGPPEAISIGFDAASECYCVDPVQPIASWKFVRTLQLFDRIRATGAKAYIESRPELGHSAWKGHIDGSIALEKTDFGKQGQRLKEAHLYGEVIRMAQTNKSSKPELITAWPDFDQVTPCARMPSLYRAEQFMRKGAGQ